MMREENLRKGEKILRALGQVEECYIAEAKPAQGLSGRSVRVKWGAAAAACLCLIVGGVYVLSQGRSATGGNAGIDGGGAGTPLTGGVEMGTPGIGMDQYSVAVYPAGADVQDVDTATVAGLDEEEARAWGTLGGCLPQSLPQGYRFKCAYLYETRMKDGTQYHMLRVTYSNGIPYTPHIVVEEDGSVGETVPTPEEMGESFAVLVWDFRPDSEFIYAPEAVTESLLRELDGRTFHIRYGDAYVGISPEGAEDGVILEFVRSFLPK